MDEEILKGDCEEDCLELYAVYADECLLLFEGKEHRLSPTRRGKIAFAILGEFYDFTRTVDVQGLAKTYATSIGFNKFSPEEIEAFLEVLYLTALCRIIDDSFVISFERIIARRKDSLGTKFHEIAFDIFVEEARWKMPVILQMDRKKVRKAEKNLTKNVSGIDFFEMGVFMGMVYEKIYRQTFLYEP